MGNKIDRILIYGSLIMFMVIIFLGLDTLDTQQKHIGVLEEELIYTQVELQGIRNTMSLIEANNDAELYIGEQEADPE